jgi:hypothetical protein
MKTNEQSLYLTTNINLTNIILSEGRKMEEHILDDFIYIPVEIKLCPALSYSIL